MADLLIDWATLQRVQTSLTHMGNVLHKPSTSMAGLGSGAAGVPSLEQRLKDFAHEWEYGFTQLQKASTSAAEALTQVVDAFKKADADLAKALTDAMSKKHAR